MGNIKNLEWMLTKKIPQNSLIFASTVKFENINILKWMHYKKFPLDAGAYKNAILTGNFEIINWMEENHFPTDDADMFDLCDDLVSLEVK